MLGILQSAAQNPNDPGRLTAANLGAAAGEAIAALIHVADTSKHESVKAEALELLDGLAPGFRKANSGMDALLRRREQVNAFVERIRSGQATAPELIEGLKQFPGMAHSATEALVRLGPQAQAVLPALRDTLAALEPNPGDNAQVPGAGYPARAVVANAIQRMAPDQPKLLFTSEDVSSVIGIWLGPSSRWLDTDRHARISQAPGPRWPI